MKKSILFLFVAASISINIYSQDDSFYNNDEQETKAVQERYHAFFGTGMGINNHCGVFGGLAEFSPSKKISILGGMGIGMWGNKFGLGMRYYNRGFPRKFFYGVTYTIATGGENVEYELETTRSDNETVIMDLKLAQNLALSIGYQWLLFKNGRLNFEVGYSIPLQAIAYEVVSDGIELSDTSKDIMQFRTPGGIVIGTAFTIGF